MPYSEYMRWTRYANEDPPVSLYALDKMLAQICFVQARCAGNKHIQRDAFEMIQRHGGSGGGMTAEQFKALLRKHMGFRKRE